MKFKKFLCLVTSILVLGNFCFPAGAMSKRRRDKRKLNPDIVWAYDSHLERQEKRRTASRNSLSASLLKAPELSSDSLKVDQSLEPAAEKSVEIVAADCTCESEEKEMQIDGPQVFGSLKNGETMRTRRPECSEEFKQKALGTHPTEGGVAFVSIDDIDPFFSKRVQKDSVYYVVSEKLRTYYQLWRDIEFKLMILKRTLPQKEYSLVYNNWWENGTQFHRNVFMAFPYYIRGAYQRAVSYPDVVFGQDDYQVKIIEHMQQEWSLESKLFDMEILTSGAYSVWTNAERCIDAAIEMENSFWKKLEVYP